MRSQALFSAFSILVLVSSGASANLLANSGFEAGLQDWQSSGGAAIRTANPLAFEGDNYVFGANTASFKVWQDVNLLSQGL